MLWDASARGEDYSNRLPTGIKGEGGVGSFYTLQKVKTL